MRLSTKDRMAITAMIDLVLREHSSPVALTGISARQKISLSSLEQLFAKLRRHGIVESTRGPGGGYSLCRKAERISVADIIQAIDDSSPGTDCPAAENGNGSRVGHISAADLWSRINSRAFEYMETISLRELAEEQRARGAYSEDPALKRVMPAPAIKPRASMAHSSVFALGKSMMD